MALCDDLGRTYSATRRGDPRIAARITAALGDATTVVNIEAGTGPTNLATLSWRSSQAGS
jgi:hypothetical protein